jgi:hypothetical protein
MSRPLGEESGRGLGVGENAPATHLQGKTPPLGGAFPVTLNGKIVRGRAASAAFPVPDDLRALLARLDPVSVAFDDFLGDPSDDGVLALSAIELGFKLLLELRDVAHVSLMWADNARPCGPARAPFRTLGMPVRSHRLGERGGTNPTGRAKRGLERP